MSFKRNRKHNQHKKHNTKRNLKKINGGLGPGSFFSSISKFIKLTKDTNDELAFINKLKTELQNNNSQIKKDVDEYASIYKQLFTRTQSLYSKIDNLTDIQSKCSKLNPNQNASSNESSDNFLFGQQFNSFFNKAKSTVTEETDELTKQTNQYATDLVNQIPFSEASQLKTTVEELKKQIVSLNDEITQLKNNNENETNLVSTALNTPISDNDLNNLDNSSDETTTPSVLEGEEEEGEPVFQPSQPQITPLPTQLGETPQPNEQPEFGETPQPEFEDTLPTNEQPELGETLPTNEQPELGETPQPNEQPELGETPQPNEQPELGETPQPNEQPEIREPPNNMFQENQDNQKNYPFTFPTNSQEEKTTSEITDIPKKDENKQQQQNAGKRRYNSSKKIKHKKMNKSRNRKNIERFYL